MYTVDTYQLIKQPSADPLHINPDCVLNLRAYVNEQHYTHQSVLLHLYTKHTVHTAAPLAKTQVLEHIHICCPTSSPPASAAETVQHERQFETSH